MFERRPLISVVVLNYNGKKYLEIVIPSLSHQTFKDFEINLVDNGSTDGSLEYVRLEFPEVIIVKNNKNSYAVGNNTGIRIAKGKYIFVINNDVEVDKNCLKELVSNISKSRANIGMWATKILNYYQREIIDNTGLLMYRDGLSRGRGRLEEDRGQFDQLKEVLMPSGCAGLYKKEMLDQVGLFDEDFEFYVEDSDLGWRARLAGWRCEYVPSARVFHMYSATLGKYSPQKAFLIERNRIWLMIKSFPNSMIFLSLLYTFNRYLLQIFGLLRGKGAASLYVKKYSKISLVIVLLKAWIASLFKLPKMLWKRIRIKKNQRVSNKEIKSWFGRYKLTAREIVIKDY